MGHGAWGNGIGVDIVDRQLGESGEEGAMGGNFAPIMRPAHDVGRLRRGGRSARPSEPPEGLVTALLTTGSGRRLAVRPSGPDWCTTVPYDRPPASLSGMLRVAEGRAARRGGGGLPGAWCPGPALGVGSTGVHVGARST